MAFKFYIAAAVATLLFTSNTKAQDGTIADYLFISYPDGDTVTMHLDTLSSVKIRIDNRDTSRGYVIRLKSEDPGLAGIDRGDFVVHSNQVDIVTVKIRGHSLGYTKVDFLYKDQSLHAQYADKYLFQDTGRRLNVVVVRDNTDVLGLIFTIVLVLLVTFGNFGMGLGTHSVGVKTVAVHNTLSFALGYFCQVIVMPLLAFNLIYIFRLDGGVALGLFLVGCGPGSGNSNLYTYLLDGAVLLSIGLTILSILTSFATMSVWMFSLGVHFVTSAEEKVNLNFGIFIAVALCLIIPLLVGLLIQAKSSEAAQRLLWLVRPIFFVLRVVIIPIGIIYGVFVGRLLTWNLFLGSLMLPILGAILGGILAFIFKQNLARGITHCICTGIQGIAFPLAMIRLVFPRPESDLAVAGPFLIGLFTGLPIVIITIIYELLRRCGPEYVETTQVIPGRGYDKHGEAMRQREETSEQREIREAKFFQREAGTQEQDKRVFLDGLYTSSGTKGADTRKEDMLSPADTFTTMAWLESRADSQVGGLTPIDLSRKVSTEEHMIAKRDGHYVTMKNEQFQTYSDTDGARTEHNIKQDYSMKESSLIISEGHSTIKSSGMPQMESSLTISEGHSAIKSSGMPSSAIKSSGMPSLAVTPATDLSVSAADDSRMTGIMGISMDGEWEKKEHVALNTREEHKKHVQKREITYASDAAAATEIPKSLTGDKSLDTSLTYKSLQAASVSPAPENTFAKQKSQMYYEEHTKHADLVVTKLDSIHSSMPSSVGDTTSPGGMMAHYKAKVGHHEPLKPTTITPEPECRPEPDAKPESGTKFQTPSIESYKSEKTHQSEGKSESHSKFQTPSITSYKSEKSHQSEVKPDSLVKFQTPSIPSYKSEKTHQSDAKPESLSNIQTKSVTSLKSEKTQQSASRSESHTRYQTPSLSSRKSEKSKATDNQ